MSTREYSADFERHQLPRRLALSALSCVTLLLVGTLLGFLAPVAVSAQTVRGATRSTTGRPVSGVVVTLSDSAGTVVRRALTDVEGRFVLAAPATGRFTLDTRRIGFRPAHVALALRAGQDTGLVLDLVPVPVTLDRVVVRAERRCGGRTDAAAGVALWEAIRQALEAQELSAATRRYAMRTVVAQRRYAADDARLVEERRDVRDGAGTRAFESLPADSLARVGYVEVMPAPAAQASAGNGASATAVEVTYRGPDARVLLSDAFARDHCFEVVASADDAQRQVGLAFRPDDRRRRAEGVIDVRGTLWVDRATSELRRIEFDYEGVPAPRVEGARGRVDYLLLPDGGWIVRDWAIRMPIVREVVTQVPERGLGRMRTERRLVREGIEESAGRVLDVRAAGRVIWTARTARLVGVVQAPSAGERGERPARVRVRFTGDGVVSAHDVALGADGAFRVDSLEPGAHRLAVVNLDADSLAAYADTVTLVAGGDASPTVVRAPTVHDVVRRLCGREMSDTSMRAIVGVVRDASGALVAGASVRASFLARVKEVSPGRLTANTERRQVRTDAAGRFLVCDVPAVRPVQLVARVAESTGELVMLRVDGQRAYGLIGLEVKK